MGGIYTGSDFEELFQIKNPAFAQAYFALEARAKRKDIVLGS